MRFVVYYVSIMETYFGPEFFAGNRQKLRTLFAGTAPIVLTANGLLQRNGDVNFPFRQDSNFWYLTGIDEPDIVLVIDKDKEYLILPEREHVKDIFDGALESGLMAQVSGIANILDYKTGWKQLSSRLGRVKHVATLAAPASYIAGNGMYTNPARSTLINRLKEFSPSSELLDLRPQLIRQRMTKQPEELLAIQKAIDITSSSLIKANKKLSSYTHEYKLEADINHMFYDRGVGNAYQPIIASDKNACTLHYTVNSDVLSAKKLVLIDVGAEVQHYAADITRTFALEPPSKRVRTIYAAVLEVQEFAMSKLKPGVLIKDYEHAVGGFMGEKLREIGLLKSIDHDRVRKYYPHSVSHSLGLDVHDVFDYDRPLEPNMVLTVEPGIYIPKEKIGIRIEDDVLITSKGAQVLSNKLPRTLL